MRLPQRPPRVTPGEMTPIELQLVFDGQRLDPKRRYLHWDDMRHRTPPNGMSREVWWFVTDLARRGIAQRLPLSDVAGKPFRFSNVDVVQELVHKIDQQASGQILTDEVVTDLRSNDRYLVSSLIEEAITSSQLEGASTTRRVAKEMLATGRQPRDRDERMITNNLQAMTYAQGLVDRELSPAEVLALHRIVSDGTLEDGESGRLQTVDDERISVVANDGTLLHEPPPADQLPARLDAMCRFANGEWTGGFIHPVVRAVILHFWLAYDHPFADGNGRSARALFYWSMLRDRYWLTQYLSVSSILRKAPAQYARSYLLTETDDNDVTYFVIYQLQVIERAIRSLHDYLARKVDETKEIERLLHGSPELNHRQIAVVGKALRDPSQSFTIAAHMHLHGVVYQSARTDLLRLAELGLFTKVKAGNAFVFRAQNGLAERLRRLGSGASA